METSLGDILSFIEKLSREEMTLSGGGCNIPVIEEDIRCPYVNFLLSIEGDDAYKWRVVKFTTTVLDDRLVSKLLGTLA